MSWRRERIAGPPWLLALLALPWLFATPARAVPEMPATMVLTGALAAGTLPGSTTPRAQDEVLAFSAVDGQLVGHGPVAARGNAYLAVLTRTASFNGTPVVLELLQGRTRYQLLTADGAPVWLPFRGRTLPERTPLALQVGRVSAVLRADEAANPQAQRLVQRPALPCSAALDADGDGVCDARDWALLGLYAGGITRSVARPSE